MSNVLQAIVGPAVGLILGALICEVGRFFGRRDERNAAAKRTETPTWRIGNFR